MSHYRDFFSLILTGEAQHSSYFVEALDICEEILSDKFRTKWISRHKDGFCNVTFFCTIVWCCHTNLLSFVDY